MRNKLISALAVGLVLAGGGIAVAQEVIGTDGGPAGAQPGQYTNSACGPETANVLRTENRPSVTSSTNPTEINGTRYEFVVPQGQERCVKVLFTAETSCTDSNTNDWCYTQALIDGVPMNPNGNGYMAIDSEDSTASAHAFQWSKKVGPGAHDLVIMHRVGNANTVFRLDDWHQDISIKLA